MRDIKKQNIKVAVDAVVFTVIKGKLHLLLIRRKYPPFINMYAFPGGFVRNDENLETAAERELYHETNVKSIFMKKLTAYGDVDRDPRGRVITVVYMALIDSEKFMLHADTDALTAEWVAEDSIKNLAFDHAKILKDALYELRFDIQTTNIACHLLPEHFTLGELQKVYEAILGKEMDKRNFRKKIKELDLLKQSRGTKMEGAHRPAQLYEFKDRKFKTLKEKMHVFI